MAKLILFSKRVDELSNMLTKVPDAINTQGVNYAVGALKGAIANLAKTAVKPSLVPQQISVKVTKLQEVALQRVDTAKAELQPLRAELTAPSALVKDLPVQKSAAEAAYRAQVNKVTKLEPSTREGLNATVKAHEANLAALSALQPKLEPVKPPIINQTLVPPRADRDAAAAALNNVKTQASDIKVPDLKPKPSAPPKPEFTPRELTQTSVANVRDAALASRSELDSAITASAANRATFDNIQLNPEPTRAPIDSAIASRNATAAQRVQRIASANGETSAARQVLFQAVRGEVARLRQASNAAKNLNETLANAQRRNAPSKPQLGDTAPLKTSQRETMDALENLQVRKDTNTVMLDFLKGRPIKDNGASLAVKASIRRLEVNNRDIDAAISALKSKVYPPPRVNPRPDSTQVDSARPLLLNATGNLSALRTSTNSLGSHVAMLTTNRGHILTRQSVNYNTATYTNLRNSSQTNVGALKGLKRTAGADKSGGFFAAKSGIGIIVRRNYEGRLLPTITLAKARRATAQTNIRSLEGSLGGSHNKLAQANSTKLAGIQAKYDVITAVLVVKGNAQREIINVLGQQGALNTNITTIKTNQTPSRADNPKPQEPSTNDLDIAQRNLADLQKAVVDATTSLADKMRERTTLNAFKEAGGIRDANTKALEAYYLLVQAIRSLRKAVKAIETDARLKALSVRDGLPTLRADAQQRPVPPLGQPPRAPDSTALTTANNALTNLTTTTKALKQKTARENPTADVLKKAYKVLTSTRETLNALNAPVKTRDKPNANSNKDAAYKNADAVKDDVNTKKQDDAASRRESQKTLERIKAV